MSSRVCNSRTRTRTEGRAGMDGEMSEQAIIIPRSNPRGTRIPLLARPRQNQQGSAPRGLCFCCVAGFSSSLDLYLSPTERIRPPSASPLKMPPPAPQMQAPPVDRYISISLNEYLSRQNEVSPLCGRSRALPVASAPRDMSSPRQPSPSPSHRIE